MSTTSVRTQINVQMKEFEHHIISTVSETMWTGYSTDCEILSMDKAFPCHRFILSAASPFFAKMFKTVDPARLPQIIIPDVSSQVLQMVISIIYQGETFVPAVFRKELIDVCKLLQLKGTQEFYGDTINPFVEPYVSIVENMPVRETDDGSMDEPMEPDYKVEDRFDDHDASSFNLTEANPGHEFNQHRKMIHSIKYSPNVNIVPTTETKYGKTERSILGEDVVEKVYERLISYCRRVFTSRLRNGESYETAEFIAEMYMNLNLLLYGKVSCVICGTKILIYYKKTTTGDFKQWDPVMLSKHLETAHKDFVHQDLVK